MSHTIRVLREPTPDAPYNAGIWLRDDSNPTQYATFTVEFIPGKALGCDFRGGNDTSDAVRAAALGWATARQTELAESLSEDELAALPEPTLAAAPVSKKAEKKAAKK